jgi:hypothetical protein
VLYCTNGTCVCATSDRKQLSQNVAANNEIICAVLQMREPVDLRAKEFVVKFIETRETKQTTCNVPLFESI